MKEPRQPIRIGIIGAGANTREKHIPELRRIPGVEIVSVANRSRASSERAAQEFGIPKVYDRWQDLAAAEDTDAIVIGTWPYLHCAATLAGLDAGKHVLCEARMAMDAQEARQMLAAARAHPELVTQIVPSPMTLRVDATIARMVAEGSLGDILAVSVQDNGANFVHPNAPLHWRQDRSRSGLNVLSLGIWYEAVQRWIGPATRVMAMGKISVPERTDPETGKPVAVSVPDHLDVLAEMACGAQAHFACSGVTGLAPSPSVWLFGSVGTLRFTLSDEALYAGHIGESALTPVDIPPEEEGHWRVEEEFIGAIRGTEPVRRTTFEDGVRYMEFTEAVARSRASGEAIPLPLP